MQQRALQQGRHPAGRGDLLRWRRVAHLGTVVELARLPLERGLQLHRIRWQGGYQARRILREHICALPFQALPGLGQAGIAVAVHQRTLDVAQRLDVQALELLHIA